MPVENKRPVLYTLDETAEILKITTRTLRRIMAQRKISFIQVGGRARFSETHLNDYLTANEVKPFDANKVRL